MTPRWRPEVAADLAVHAAIRAQPRHVLPQLVGLSQYLPDYLSEEPRLRGWAEAYLAEACAAVTSQTPHYREARAAAARQRPLPAPARAAQDRLRARWQTPTVTEALVVVVWLVRAYLRIHARRHGIVPEPWTTTFHWHHRGHVEGMAATLQQGAEAADG
jgi:hypothetical protein